MRTYEMHAFLDMLPKIWVARRSKSLNVASAEREKPDASEESVSLTVDVDVCKDYLQLAQSLYYLRSQYMKDMTSSGKQQKAFKAMEIELNVLFDDVSVITNFDIILLIAVSYTFLGDIYMMHDLLNPAEECYTKSVELLKGKELDPKAIVVVLYTYQRLSCCIYSDTANQEKRYRLLITAIFLYRKYTEEENYPYPARFFDILNIKDMMDKNMPDARVMLDQCHLVDLKQLAHLYNIYMYDRDEFVLYMHELLKKTMEEALLQSGHIQWSIACIHLAYYFIYSNHFTEAKSHIATASKVIAEYKDKVCTQDESLPSKEIHESCSLHHALVKLGMAWGIYGLILLRGSKERLLSQNITCDVTFNLETLLLFDEKFETTLHSDIAKQSIFDTTFPDQYVENFNDAMKLVVRTNISLSRTKTCCKELKGVFGGIETILYMSRLYKYLPYFEVDVTKQVMWHNKRIKILESAIKEFSGSNEQDVLHHWYVLHLEMGIAYSILLDISAETLARTGEDIVEKTLGLRVQPSMIFDTLVKYLNIKTLYPEEKEIVHQTV